MLSILEEVFNLLMFNIVHITQKKGVDQRSIAEDRYLSDPHARVHRVFTARQLLPALAMGLVQGPVRHSGTSTHWPFSAGSSLPAPYRAPGLGHLTTLSRHRRSSWTSGVPVFGPRSGQERHVARKQLYNIFATFLELPGMVWGGDSPPLWPGEREGGERERKELSLLFAFSLQPIRSII